MKMILVDVALSQISPFSFLSQATFTSDHPSEPNQGALSLLTNFSVCAVRSHIPGYGVAGCRSLVEP